jgi:Cys-rich protein (TIGR01571 family)
MGKSFEFGLINPKSCIDDWKLCLLSYFFPGAVFGMGAEKAMGDYDGYRCLIIASIPFVNYCVLPCWRKTIREKKGVDGNFLFDCLAAYCCPCCTIFQGAHEAGIDGSNEFSKTCEIMQRTVTEFNPKKEAEKAKDQSKDAAVDIKDEAKEVTA